MEAAIAVNPGHRRAGRLVTAAILAVLVATLTPASANVPISGPWCLLCGQAGTIDALQNVVLFLPLGFGLAWQGWSRGSTAVAAFALSAFVETMQFTLIQGRDASLGDLLFNTIGGVVGFALQRANLDPLRPGRGTGIALRAGAGLAWLLALLLAAFGFRPAVPPGPPEEWVTTIPFDSADGRYFSGKVRAIQVNGVPFLFSGPSALDRVRSELGARPSMITMEIQPGRPTSEYATIVAVQAGKVHPFSFGQQTRELRCQRFLAASAILLRTPVFVLPSAFPPAAPPIEEQGESYMLHCIWADGRIIVRRVSAGGFAEVSVPLTPGLGWTLFLPAALGASDARTRSLAFIWLVVIAAPLGFWSCTPPRPVVPLDSSPQYIRVSGWLPPLILLFTLLLAQYALPAFAGTAPSPAREYFATVSGFLLGMGLAHLMRSRHRFTIGS